jgi:hypothetical protein
LSARGAVRAAVLGPLVLLAGGCVLLQLPIQIITLVLTGVFRLGEAAINALGSAARALGPYLLFWAANDPGRNPDASEVEGAILAAARERPTVEEGLERALGSGPAAADSALLVPLGDVLEPDGLRGIARSLRGRRIVAVTFARIPEREEARAPGPGSPCASRP